MTYSVKDWNQDGDFDRWYCDESGKAISRRLDDQRASTILEVGSATGRMTAALVRRDRWVVAVERDPAMVEMSRQRRLLGAQFLRGDIKNLNFGSSFDAVIIASVLHEVDDPADMVAFCATLLSDHNRARIFVTVPSAHSLHHQGKATLGARAQRFGVRRIWPPAKWLEELTHGTGLRGYSVTGLMLKPWPNETMACLAPDVLEFLAKYRGPAGAISLIELARADR